MIWVWVAVLGSPEVGWTGVASEAEYREIRNLTLRILQDHPLSEHYFLGVGRSPTPVVSFLQQLSPGSASNFPLSGFMARPQEAVSKYHKPLSPAQEENLFRHMDRFFPSESKLAGRKVVLLDFSQSGDTLVGVHDYIQKYAQLRGRKIDVTVVALVESVLKPEVVSNLGSRLSKSYVMGYYPHVLEGLETERYDLHAAEYTEFHLGETDPAGLKPRREYQEFSASLRQRLLTDPKFHKRKSHCIGTQLGW